MGEARVVSLSYKEDKMAFSETMRKMYQSELEGIKNAGIFKEERFIHSSQAADIEVEFPTGSSLKKVINMWREKISDFNTNSIVIFNETKFKDQWAYKNPMLNWNELKTKYTLQELKDFGSGWKAFEMRDK